MYGRLQPSLSRIKKRLWPESQRLAWLGEARWLHRVLMSLEWLDPSILLAGLIGAGSVVLLAMVLHRKRGKIVKLNLCKKHFI